MDSIWCLLPHLSEDMDANADNGRTMSPVPSGGPQIEPEAIPVNLALFFFLGIEIRGIIYSFMQHPIKDCCGAIKIGWAISGLRPWSDPLKMKTYPDLNHGYI